MSQKNWFVHIYSDCDRPMGLEIGLAGAILVITVLVFIQKALNYFASVNTLISRDRKSIIGYYTFVVFLHSLLSHFVLLFLPFPPTLSLLLFVDLRPLQ